MNNGDSVHDDGDDDEVAAAASTDDAAAAAAAESGRIADNADVLRMLFDDGGCSGSSVVVFDFVRWTGGSCCLCC